MNKVEITSLVASLRVTETQFDFDEVAQDIEKASKVQHGVPSETEGNVITEQDFIDMVIEQTLINESIRQMKENQQRLEEILDEV